MARVVLEKLAHSYGANPVRDEDYALKPMDMAFEQGGAYALLGPSGCGKTSLLNIISGLVAPTRGRVLFDGKDVTHLATEKRNIAQVFQFPVVYDTMSVRQNLAFPLKNRNMDQAAIAVRVREIADLLELSGELDRKARGLTADAKQKISLGRGLVRPDVAAILFDEPLTVIDPHLKWELRSKLKQLHARLDLTMIYVTHDQTEALTFADQVVVMLDGRVVQLGTPDELFERPAHTFVGHFIGSPGMNLLPCTLEGAGVVVGGHSIAINAPPASRPDGKLELGIRPEYIRLGKPGEGLPVTITRVDDLGRVRIARVTFAGHALAVMVPENGEISGKDAGMVLDPARIGLYADGVRVPAPQRGAQ
jgi:glycerol transport system ATP-binding protein